MRLEGNSMFCTKCGTENSNDAKFCKKCGNPMSVAPAEPKKEVKEAASEPVATTAPEAAPAPAPTPAPTPAPAPAPTPTPAPTPAATLKKPIEKKSVSINTGLLVKLGIAIGAALIAIIAIVLVVMNMGKTINLNKYVIHEVSGYDGYGKAVVSIDWDSMKEDYDKKLKFTRKAKKDMGVDYLKYVSPVDVIRGYINVDIDKDKLIANGDELLTTFEVNESVSEYVNCKIKYKDDTYKVEELTKLATFDPFVDLEVTFSGIAPYGSINMVYTGSELNSYDFQASQYDNLSNGDIITIKIEDYKVEDCANSYGKIPATTSKEYTVSGLSQYVTKLEDIDDDSFAMMKAQATDVYNAYVARDWAEDTSHLESFTYLGEYLMTVKNPDSYYGANNELYLVYKIQARNNFTNDKNETFNKITDVYWYIKYENLMVNEGKLVDFDVTRYQIPYTNFQIDSNVRSGWSTMRWRYVGYETLDSLYKEVVTSKIDTYNHQDRIDESVAPATVVEEPATESAYILEKSSTELITKADLEGFTADECKKARNEIYARHGRKFADAALQEYFNSCAWYEGTVEPDDFSEDVLSDIEKANRDLIVEFEKEQGYN